MEKWIGNLFYRRVSVTEIKEMSYWEMKYWNKWHEIMAQADKNVIPKDE